nr:glutathione s-transferase [Quercus suber]
MSKFPQNSKMPAFTLYGFLGSTNTDRVRLALAEGGLTDYKLALLNLQKGEQKAKDDLKRHPWGKIPVITFPDGFTLYESRAICRYLAKKYSLPLIPPESDIEATALFDQAQSAETLYFSEPASRLTSEKFAKRLMGLPPDEAIVSTALQSVELFFDVAERLLRHKSYMAGNDFSLVDIYYIPLIQRLFACGYGDVIVRREAVSGWWNRCVNRPAIQRMLAADKEAAATATIKYDEKLVVLTTTRQSGEGSVWFTLAQGVVAADPLVETERRMGYAKLSLEVDYSRSNNAYRCALLSELI